MRCASSNAATSASMQMTGNWAGEFGGMQFTPSNYIKYGVDFDGDGRRDLIKSVPDTLASAANYLKQIGWQRGQPWLQEVRVPETCRGGKPISTSSIRARSGWPGACRRRTVRCRATNMPASLILPMGRFGPAFLAYPNFKVFLEWNSAFVYSTTVAYFAARLGGAQPVNEEGAKRVQALSTAQMKELQTL